MFNVISRINLLAGNTLEHISHLVSQSIPGHTKDVPSNVLYDMHINKHILWELLLVFIILFEMATTLAKVPTSSEVLGGMGPGFLMTLTLHQNIIQHPINL